MAASYPGSVPDLAALVLSNPQSYAQFTRLIEELQAALTTLGANPQGASGTVDARLDALEAALTVAANTGYRNLRVGTNTTTPTTKLDVAADVLAVEGELKSGVAVTIDLTATGKNGMTATRAVSTWYYAWIGVHPTTGEVCGILDDSPDRAAIDVSHGSLSGFVKWRRVGAARTNATGSGELVRHLQQDGCCLYAALNDNVQYSSTANVRQTRTVSNSVPATTRLALIGFEVQGGTSSAQQLWVEWQGVTGGRLILDAYPATQTTWVALNTSRQFDWYTVQNTTNGVFLWVAGYQDTL